jgi:hypothetical protein
LGLALFEQSWSNWRCQFIGLGIRSASGVEADLERGKFHNQ